MFWKRCLILLFILLQPLRGFAEAQAAFCGVAPPSSPPASAHQHTHHHDASSQSDGSVQADIQLNHDNQANNGAHAGQHGHGKTCGSCCQACAPVLSASALDSEVPIPVAPEIHRVERTPPSPVENHIRPPIA